MTTSRIRWLIVAAVLAVPAASACATTVDLPAGHQATKRLPADDPRLQHPTAPDLEATAYCGDTDHLTVDPQTATAVVDEARSAVELEQAGSPLGSGVRSFRCVQVMTSHDGISVTALAEFWQTVSQQQPNGDTVYAQPMNEVEVKALAIRDGAGYRIKSYTWDFTERGRP